MIRRLPGIVIASSMALLAQASPPADSKDSDQPHRTVHASSATTTAPSASDERTRSANPHALDSLVSSTDDLNIIRDSNVRKLTKDGCSPEVSGRMAEVTARIRASEAELKGIDPPPAAHEKAASAPQGSAQAIASDWFKAAGPAASGGDSHAKPKDLLDSVLPGGPPKPAVQPKAPLTPEKRQDMEKEVAALKSELEHLSVACPGAKP